MEVLRLTEADLSSGDEWLGTFAAPEHIQRLVTTTTRVERPDGTPLAVLLKGAISKPAGAAMYRAIRTRIGKTFNRGIATGTKPEDKVRIKKDGTVAKTGKALQVESGIMGFFDRNPRMPYCRQTAFMEQYPAAYQACLPALREADAAFAEHLPEHYGRQKNVVAETHPDFIIPGTVFTTITLNRNFRTAYHRDAGDFADGFGVITAYRGGRFKGGNLVFPAFGTAFALDSFDLLLFDPHEVHGNTEITDKSENWERITCVHYYRENMVYCGSAAQELEMARRHDPRQAPRNLRTKPAPEGE